MRRIRQLLLTVGITVALLLPLAGAASADPGDGGGSPGAATSRSAARPIAPTTATDPGDGGGF